MASEAPPEESVYEQQPPSPDSAAKTARPKVKSRDKDVLSVKRRCVSTACVSCRRRKSKCDGNLPSCAACASVYGTECIYDPNSDHRRKGVYKKDIDNLKTRNSTLQTLIQGILNFPEDEALDLVKQIRSCESLDDVAEAVMARDAAIQEEDALARGLEDERGDVPKFASELSGKMGELRLQGGALQFLGGTSNLLFLDAPTAGSTVYTPNGSRKHYLSQEEAVISWTEVTNDPGLVVHLVNMYFTWHYTYFTTLSKSIFFKEFLRGAPAPSERRTHEHCTPLLVNSMLALGCHFTQWPAARADELDTSTAGDHFFREAKRLLLANDELEIPRLPTVQALALMSVREAGCGREAKGWVYSGMSFRMAIDLGLDIDSNNASLDEKEIDARRITFWGCFLFDKCWSNYLGRPPQLPLVNITVPKFDVFPIEDADLWSPWTDNGVGSENIQPSRTRAIALQISLLCEISSDLIMTFYHPTHIEKPVSKQAQLKKLSELHTRLEAWRKALPKEMEAREGQLPNVLVMHMFYQLLFIHLFRPFLKYTPTNSPLPASVSPRKHCTHAASMISKLLRIYKRTHGLMQICNIAVYIAHSACTIHILNLPDKEAKRDISHGVKHLEEIAESWPCARRTLAILSVQVKKWQVELPDDAAATLARADAAWSSHKSEHNSPASDLPSPTRMVLQNFPQIVLNQHPFLTERMNSSSPTTHSPGPSSIINNITNNNFSGIDDSFLYEFPITTPPLPSSSSPLSMASLPKPSHALSTAQKQAWMQNRLTRNVFPKSKSSPTALFGGVDALIEDSKEWWLKDQSAIFDGWPRVVDHGGSQSGNGMNVDFISGQTNGMTAAETLVSPTMSAGLNGAAAAGLPSNTNSTLGGPTATTTEIGRPGGVAAQASGPDKKTASMAGPSFEGLDFLDFVPGNYGYTKDGTTY